MNRPIRSLTRRGLLALLCLAFAPLAQAQEYPTVKPIRLVVAYPPGGAGDTIGRLIGLKLGERLGQSIILENRPGFSGNIGTAYVAKSPPDGYTLLLTPWTTFVLNSILYGPEKVGYTLEKDLAPISVIGYQPMVLMVNPSVPATSVPELIKLAKASPGTLSFGSTGPGSLEHISAEMFKRQTGVDILHVPYKGNGPAVTDLIGGQIQMLFTTAPTWAANEKSGRLRALMVTSPERSKAFPTLPSPKESGIPEFEARSTYGITAPAGTPAAIIKRLNAEMVHVLKDPEVIDKLAAMGMDVQSSTPEELGRRIAADTVKWRTVIEQQGIKPE